MRIQRETGARIYLPPRHSKSNKITISGAEESIEAAILQIQNICEDVKNKLAPTHFLNFPLNISGLQMNVNSFFNEIRGLIGGNEDILAKTAKMHLTLFMLRLLTGKEVERACDVLAKLSPRVYDALGTRSLILKVAGLGVMNENATEARVMYAKVREVGGGGRLQKVIEIIGEAFLKEGLIDERAVRELKLHVTLINAKNGRFDATKILDRFGSRDFGEHRVSSIHLSQRFKFDEGKLLPFFLPHL